MSYMYDHFMVNENRRAQKNGHSVWDLAGEQGLVQTARAGKPNSCSRQLVSHRPMPLISLTRSDTTRGENDEM